MRRNKKSVGVWIGEALLIFFSIMLAFYIENYREQRSKEAAYINQLKDFHFDLMVNQGRMEVDLRKPNGTIERNFRTYDSLLKMLSRLDSNEMPQVINLMGDAEVPMAKWFFMSPHLDLLMTDYHAYVKNVNLKRSMTIHRRRMQFIDRMKDEMKRLTEKLHPYFDRLDHSNPSSNRNRQVLNDIELYNLVSRLDRKVLELRIQYHLTKQQDSLIAVDIEKELGLWDESL